MVNPMDLSGKRILVTGATGGMGRVTSIQLSKLGAKVVLCDMNEDALKEVYDQLEGEGHASYCFNLNDVDGIEALVKQMIAECGHLK